MKIVKFSKYFSKRSQTFIYNLACGLREECPELRVLTLQRRNSGTRPFEVVDVLEDETQATEDGVSGRLRHVISRVPVIRQFVADADTARITRRFVEYLKEQRPDIVHAHFGPHAYKIYPACVTTGTPLIVSFRGYDASAYVREWAWRVRYRKMLAYCEAVLVVSDEMRSRIAPLAGDTTLVTIHAGKRIDDYPFRPPRAPMTQLVSVGRLVEKKGHVDAIRAVQRARQMGADVTLRIIGDGEDRHTLERYIESHGLSEWVELAGAVPHAEVKGALGRADGFILASRTAADGDKEGVPNALKEAQLMGVPVISTRHAGIPDVVPAPNHRWLAPEGDWRRLGELVRELHGCDEQTLREMAELARGHVAQHFSLQEEVRRHIEVYHEVFARGEER
jgi:colanic acid/amylovoran biosynthesis glycosyltransferase